LEFSAAFWFKPIPLLIIDCVSVLERELSACEEEKEFLHELQQNYPQVEMRWFDVGARPEFVDLAMLLCERQKISERVFP
jgi:hypothetical protein